MDGLSINSRLTDFFDNEGGFDVRINKFYLMNYSNYLLKMKLII